VLPQKPKTIETEEQKEVSLSEDDFSIESDDEPVKEEQQDKPVRNKRLSLLLETAPPATIKQKKSWRMSVANIEEHQPEKQPEQSKPRPHSMIKFASLRIKK